jgi:hypothetical protein
VQGLTESSAVLCSATQGCRAQAQVSVMAAWSGQHFIYTAVLAGLAHIWDFPAC